MVSYRGETTAGDDGGGGALLVVATDACAGDGGDPPVPAAELPADDAALPDLRADPPGRAVLAYHSREFFEPGGWASERIFFLGTDGAWPGRWTRGPARFVARRAPCRWRPTRTTPVARLVARSIIPLGWLDADRVLLGLNRIGPLTWHIGTGEVRVLTRDRPPLQPDSWWTVAVALDLAR